MRSRIPATAAIAALSGGAVAQVVLVDATHHQFVYVETTLEGSDDETRGGSRFGDYSDTATLGLGDPLAAWGSASETSTTLPDGSVITGLLRADSYVHNSDTNTGYNYTSSSIRIDFSASGPAELIADYSILLSDESPSFAYFLMQVFDVDAGTAVFQEDFWGEQDQTLHREVSLTPGNYYVTFSVSAESDATDFPLTELEAHAEVSYGVTFVPAPASVAALALGAVARRRRP